MNSKNRERLMVSFLPALLVVIVWFGWFRPGLARQAADARLDLSEAKKSSASDEAVFDSLERKRRAQEQLNEALARKSQLSGEWHEVVRGASADDEPARSIQQLTTLFAARGLNLLSQEVAKDQESKMPALALTRMADRLRAPQVWEKPTPGGASPAPAPVAPDTSNLVAPTGSPRPHAIWKFELAGPYASMTQALDAIVKEAPRAVVVQVLMHDADPALELRRWTLFLAL